MSSVQIYNCIDMSLLFVNSNYLYKNLYYHIGLSKIYKVMLVHSFLMNEHDFFFIINKSVLKCRSPP